MATPPAPSSSLIPPASTSAVESPATSFQVAVISDLNGSYGSTEYGPAVHQAVERILSMRPALVISTGDMVAGQRGGRRIDHRAMWRAFHAAVTDRLAAAGIPFVVTPGNHDASAYPRFASERAIFIDEWSTRRANIEFIDDRFYPLRYAFRLGQAVFISLDATTSGRLPAEQMAWLTDILERTADAGPRIVFGHVPLYPFTQGRESEFIGDPALETLLHDAHVDLVLSGHHHGFFPGERNGLALVSVACLGAAPRPLIGAEADSSRALVTFEVGTDGISGLRALLPPRFDTVLDFASLPLEVGIPDAPVRRCDRLATPATP